MSDATIILWAELHQLAEAASRYFRLNFRQLEPLINMRARMYGDITNADIIRLRLHRLGRPNSPLKRSTIIDTLAHELAHLKVLRHGRQHRELRKSIMEFWKERGMI